jgi:hypothetical protein
MKCRVLFAKPNKKFPVFSWLIRLCEGTNYSHVALEIEADELSIVFDSVFPRSRILSKEEWLKGHRVISFVELGETKSTIKQLIQSCAELSGKKYSQNQIVKIALLTLGGAIARKIIRLTKNSTSRLICVEAVARIVERHFGVSSFPVPVDILGLDELEKVLKSEGVGNA